MNNLYLDLHYGKFNYGDDLRAYYKERLEKMARDLASGSGILIKDDDIVTLKTKLEVCRSESLREMKNSMSDKPRPASWHLAHLLLFLLMLLIGSALITTVFLTVIAVLYLTGMDAGAEFETTGRLGQGVIIVMSVVLGVMFYSLARDIERRHEYKRASERERYYEAAIVALDEEFPSIGEFLSLEDLELEDDYSVLLEERVQEYIEQPVAKVRPVMMTLNVLAAAWL